MKITSDSFNPVLIKELRQNFHGKIFLVTMVLLLLAQLGTLFVIYAEYSENPESILRGGMGKSLYGGTLAWFGLACGLLCGLSVISRFTQERSNPELDFTRFCAMSPIQILWGKMTSSFVVALYLLSLCMPFLVIAYFLRGISIINIAIGVVCAILGALALIQVALFIGSIGQKMLAGILVFGSIWGGMGLVGFISMIIYQFLGRTAPTRNPYLLIAFLITMAVIALGFIFVLNLAMLSAPFANRTLPARIYVIVLVLLSPAVAVFVWKLTSSRPPLLDVMTIVVVFGLVVSSCLCSIIAAFERSVIGPRVQRQCPQTPLKRFGFFLISSGSGGGITLAWILQLLAVAVALGTLPFYSKSHSSFYINERFIILAFGFACLLYTEIGLYIHKSFNVMPIVGWLLVTVIVVFIPLFLYAFASVVYDSKHLTHINYILITTPFYLPAVDNTFLKLTDIDCWFIPFLSLLGLGFAFPHIIEQFKSLRVSSDK